MITKETIKAKLDYIEEDCQNAYYDLPEFEACDEYVWDNYCENYYSLIEECDDEEEKEEFLNQISVEDFVDWLNCTGD